MAKCSSLNADKSVDDEVSVNVASDTCEAHEDIAH